MEIGWRYRNQSGEEKVATLVIPMWSLRVMFIVTLAVFVGWTAYGVLTRMENRGELESRYDGDGESPQPRVWKRT